MPPRWSRTRIGLAVVVTLIAGTVLLGWLTDLDEATRFFSDWAPMTPATAVCVLLLAWTPLLPRHLAALLAVLPAALSAVVLVQFATGVVEHLDTALFTVATDGESPGRMAASTAACLLLLAATQLLPPRAVRGVWLGEALALVVVVVTGVAFLGYLYDVSILYSPGTTTRMALHTAAALNLIAVGVLMSVPGGALAWVAAGRDPGAVLLRMLLPVLALAVPLMGYLVLLGEAAGWYGPTSMAALMAVTAMAVVGGTAWHTARLLRTVDARRQLAHAQVHALNVDLEDRVQARVEELERERGRSAVLNDRQRIAADMHDHVVQGLYAVALSLSAAARRGVAEETLTGAIAGIDEAIRDLRASIFELKHPPVAGDLVGRLDKLVTTAGDTSALSVSLTTSGPVDLVSDGVAEHLVAAMREALSNAVRHANAAEVAVAVEVTGAEVLLIVDDDGTGMDSELTSSSGLRNMRDRAEQLGGSCTWRPRQPRGTTVTWRAPLATAATRAMPAQRSHAGEVVLTRSVLSALAGLARRLGSLRDEDPVEVVGQEAARLVGADGMTVLVETGPATMRIRVAAGFPGGGVDVVGREVPKQASMAGHVIETGQPLNIDMLSDTPAALALFGRLPFGPAVVVPVEGEPRGVLVLARHAPRVSFTDVDVHRAQSLAVFVGLALALRPDHAGAGHRSPGRWRQ